MSSSSKRNSNRVIIKITKKVAIIFAGPLSMDSGYTIQRLGKGILFKGNTRNYKKYLTLIGNWNATHQGWILGRSRSSDIKALFPNVKLIKAILETKSKSKSKASVLSVEDLDEDLDF